MLALATITILPPTPSVAHHPEGKSYKLDQFQPPSWGVGADLSSGGHGSNCWVLTLKPPHLN